MAQEILVIGAGYGGLASACLLQDIGYMVTLLEAHSLIGGCASYYRRKDYLFDVGATTFSGMRETQPVGHLFRILGIEPPLVHLNPGMIVYLNEKKIVREADPEKWIETCESIFGKKGQREFWELVYEINALAWDFISKNPYLPPKSFRDFLSLFKIHNLNKIRLLPYLLLTPKQILKRFGIENSDFYSFITEQLLITVQSLPDETPFLSASMGLAYPSETYYPMGGMTAPAQLLLEKFLQKGGIFHKKEKLIKINRIGKKYHVLTEKGNSFSGDILIANLSIWNLEKITEGDMSRYYKKLVKRFPRGPGAFVINLGGKLKKELPTYYFQVHSRSPLPFTESNSFFVSFSHKDDQIRAKQGNVAVTISIHTNPADWFEIGKETYLERKEKLEEAILLEFKDRFGDYLDIDENVVYTATPKTYLDYTSRFMGYVGGIAHRVFPNPLQFPNGKTPFRGFYQVGDTVFPGQGIPAVIYSALSVVEDIKYEYIID